MSVSGSRLPSLAAMFSLDVAEFAHARDYGRHGRVLKDVPQRQFGERHPFRHDRLEPSTRSSVGVSFSGVK